MIPCLQGLRVLFSSLVVYSHIYYPSLPPFEKRDGFEGPHGVTFFFMVSGLLAYRTLHWDVKQQVKHSRILAGIRASLRFILCRVPPMFIFTLLTHTAFFFFALSDLPQDFWDYFKWTTNPLTGFWGVGVRTDDIIDRFYHLNPVYWYLGQITFFWLLTPLFFFPVHLIFRRNKAMISFAVLVTCAIDALLYMRIAPDYGQEMWERAAVYLASSTWVCKYVTGLLIGALSVALSSSTRTLTVSTPTGTPTANQAPEPLTVLWWKRFTERISFDMVVIAAVCVQYFAPLSKWGKADFMAEPAWYFGPTCTIGLILLVIGWGRKCITFQAFDSRWVYRIAPGNVPFLVYSLHLPVMWATYGSRTKQQSGQATGYLVLYMTCLLVDAIIYSPLNKAFKSVLRS